MWCFNTCICVLCSGERYGLLQEGIYSYGAEGQRFAYTWTLLTLQCVTNVCGAFVLQTYNGQSPQGVPPTAFILPATTYIIGACCIQCFLRVVRPHAAAGPFATTAQMHRQGGACHSALAISLNA